MEWALGICFPQVQNRMFSVGLRGLWEPRLPNMSYSGALHVDEVTGTPGLATAPLWSWGPVAAPPSAQPRFACSLSC